MVNPIGPDPSWNPGDAFPLHKTILNQMVSLEKQYRTIMTEFSHASSKKRPLYQQKLHEICLKMRNFLIDHKDEIFNAAEKRGWPAHSEQNDSYAGDYNKIMGSLDLIIPETAKGHHIPLPELGGQLDFLNEQFTQYTWLLGNDCPFPHT